MNTFLQDYFTLYIFDQVCKQLEVLGKLGESDPNSQKLKEALGLVNHHDAITGTERQHVAFDYAKRLSMGAADCKVRCSEEHRM